MSWSVLKIIKVVFRLNCVLSIIISWHAIFPYVAIKIGFSTENTFLTSEASGAVAITVGVFNGTIGEGNIVRIRLATAGNNSAQGMQHSYM